MQFADLTVISGAAQPVPESSVDAASAELGLPFPPGYREMMTTLGPGGLFGEVFIYGPEEVIEHARAERWFAAWVLRGEQPHLTVAHSGTDVVPNEALLKFVPLGHTTDGDALFLHPGKPGVIYAAVRDFRQEELSGPGGLHLAGSELLEACRYVRRAFTPLVFVPSRRPS